MDKYTKRILKDIKSSVTEEDIGMVVDRVYEDGFMDGYNKALKEKDR